MRFSYFSKDLVCYWNGHKSRGLQVELLEVGGVRVWGRYVWCIHIEIMFKDIKTVRNVRIDSILKVIYQMLLR